MDKNKLVTDLLGKAGLGEAAGAMEAKEVIKAAMKDYDNFKKTME